MGLHQVDQYMIMGVPERQGREKTGLFEQIMAKFPKLDEQHEYVYTCKKFNEIQVEVQRDPHGTHCNQKQRQKENLQRRKRKATCYKASSIDFQRISQQKTCRPEDSKKRTERKKKHQLRWIQFFKKYKNKQSLLVVTMEWENGPRMILRFFFL